MTTPIVVGCDPGIDDDDALPPTVALLDTRAVDPLAAAIEPVLVEVDAARGLAPIVERISGLGLRLSQWPMSSCSSRCPPAHGTRTSSTPGSARSCVPRL